jgi:hypothetical protein
VTGTAAGAEVPLTDRIARDEVTRPQHLLKLRAG